MSVKKLARFGLRALCLLAALLVASPAQPDGFGVATQAATPSGVAGLQLWLRADQGVTFGAAAVPVHFAGTGPANLQPTGTPVSTVQSLEIDITTGGTVGNALFTWKLNGTAQQTGQTTASTFVLGSTGVTWNFAAGTYVATDVYTTVPAISQWQSIEGNAYDFVQATASKMPAWLAPGLSLSGWPSGINGQAGVLFNGSTTILSDATFPSVAQPITAYIEGVLTTSASSTEIAFCDTSDNLYFDSGTPNVLGFTAVPGMAAVTQTSRFLLSAVVNGSSSRVPANNAALTSGGSPHMAGGASVGMNPGGDPWNGQIDEVALYTTAHNLATSSAEVGYFENRYAN